MSELLTDKDKDLMISWIELITGDAISNDKSDSFIENIYIAIVEDHGEEILY
ncbi:hypothetical protein [Heyndrickxia ginsengihumi]|uniref:hypothetical protein n=1 Tax=Heyndrickxia ginsengihumi TaxID=363870 RepID=UPI0004B11905|nr:hypothetical protein [Heyndrickxia ginsengihumi]